MPAAQAVGATRHMRKVRTCPGTNEAPARAGRLCRARGVEGVRLPDLPSPWA